MHTHDMGKEASIPSSLSSLSLFPPLLNLVSTHCLYFPFLGVEIINLVTTLNIEYLH